MSNPPRLGNCSVRAAARQLVLVFAPADRRWARRSGSGDGGRRGGGASGPAGRLESAWHAGEALYAAFVLVLVLGLAWNQIDLDAAELYVGEQLQRVGHKLIRREVKTETSEAPLPLPDLCIAVLKIRSKQQDADRAKAGDGWIETGLVFTTRHGTPIEPRNFNRSFDRCITAARVPRITRPRHPQDLRLTAGRARRPPARGNVRPAV